MISFERLKKWSRGFHQWLRPSFRLTFREKRLIGQLTKAPYRVEQVLLIERISGILLGHLEADENLRAEAAHKSDMVAAMLSAIMTFVAVSFATEGHVMERMHVGGELEVWIETGEHVVLATVVRGAPPQWLGPRLKAVLAEIEETFSDSDDQFDVDGEFSRIDTRKTVLARCFKE